MAGMRPGDRVEWECAAIVDDWFDPSTGLLLREVRDIALKVGSGFVGRLDYTDKSAYTLLSVTPDR